MSEPIPLFEVNPALDRRALAAQFARDKRIQIRDVLTERTAREILKVLGTGTHWGMSWQAGREGPHHWRPEQMGRLTPQESQNMSASVGAAMQGHDYAFVYAAYPMVDAVKEGWDPGSPQDLLLEHINDEPFLQLVRDVTGIPELVKADAQATLYGPSNFLAMHNDSHMAEGWRIAYVLNLTAVEHWRPDWGGYLLFYDENDDVIAGYRPRFNALNMFAVPQKHNVSYVPPFSPVGRFAITGWFRDR